MAPRGCCSRSRSPARTFFRSARGRRCWCSRFAFGLALLTGIVFGAAPAWFATRTDPVDALRGSGRSTSDHSSFARKALLDRAGDAVGRARRRRDDAGAQPEQARASGLRLSKCTGASSSSLNRPPATYTLPKLAALYRADRGSAESPARRRRLGPRALQPAHGQLGRTGPGRRPPAAEAGRADAGASWDRVSANYLQNFGMTMARGRDVHGGRQRNDRAGRDRQRGVREALLQERRRSARPALRPRSAGERRHLPHRRRRRATRSSPASRCGRPARPMFYVPLAQNVDYKNALMTRLETAVALHRRHDAGDACAAGRARAADHEDARGASIRT